MSSAYSPAARSGSPDDTSILDRRREDIRIGIAGSQSPPPRLSADCECSPDRRSTSDSPPISPNASTILVPKDPHIMSPFDDFYEYSDPPKPKHSGSAELLGSSSRRFSSSESRPRLGRRHSFEDPFESSHRRLHAVERKGSRTPPYGREMHGVRPPPPPPPPPPQPPPPQRRSPNLQHRRSPHFEDDPQFPPFVTLPRASRAGFDDRRHSAQERSRTPTGSSAYDPSIFSPVPTRPRPPPPSPPTSSSYHTSRIQSAGSTNSASSSSNTPIVSSRSARSRSPSSVSEDAPLTLQRKKSRDSDNTSASSDISSLEGGKPKDYAKKLRAEVEAHLAKPNLARRGFGRGGGGMWSRPNNSPVALAALTRTAALPPLLTQHGRAFRSGSADPGRTSPVGGNVQISTTRTGSEFPLDLRYSGHHLPPMRAVVSLPPPPVQHFAKFRTHTEYHDVIVEEPDDDEGGSTGKGVSDEQMAGEDEERWWYADGRESSHRPDIRGRPSLEDEIREVGGSTPAGQSMDYVPRQNGKRVRRSKSSMIRFSSADSNPRRMSDVVRRNWGVSARKSPTPRSSSASPTPRFSSPSPRLRPPSPSLRTSPNLDHRGGNDIVDVSGLSLGRRLSRSLPPLDSESQDPNAEPGRQSPQAIARERKLVMQMEQVQRQRAHSECWGGINEIVFATGAEGLKEGFHAEMVSTSVFVSPKTLMVWRSCVSFYGIGILVVCAFIGPLSWKLAGDLAILSWFGLCIYFVNATIQSISFVAHGEAVLLIAPRTKIARLLYLSLYNFASTYQLIVPLSYWVLTTWSARADIHSTAPASESAPPATSFETQPSAGPYPLHLWSTMSFRHPKNPLETFIAANWGVGCIAMWVELGLGRMPVKAGHWWMPVLGMLGYWCWSLILVEIFKPTTDFSGFWIWLYVPFDTNLLSVQPTTPAPSVYNFLMVAGSSFAAVVLGFAAVVALHHVRNRMIATRVLAMATLRRRNQRDSGVVPEMVHV
ncbi:hypothetical protein BJ742DRAFT_95866 [Cladochytrium replicatum]|nr:hypothetical protein BJ742DRAFT_95866 [Cladochytrium replicatum]